MEGEGVLVGIDADEQNLSLAKKRLDSQGGTTEYIRANFRDVANLSLQPFDVIFADLGVSSPHFDDPERGFTFRFDSPLDMRYDRTAGLTAAQLIEQNSEKELEGIFREYGELSGARKLSQRLKADLPKTTAQAKECAEKCFGYRAPSLLPQVFQALRIAVNQEMQSLKTFLDAAITLLVPGGRLGVISYHSLEDRMVKQLFRALSTPEIDERTGAPLAPAPYVLLTKKPVVPSPEEMERNPRSRSAKFRVLQRRLP